MSQNIKMMEQIIKLKKENEQLKKIAEDQQKMILNALDYIKIINKEKEDLQKELYDYREAIAESVPVIFPNTDDRGLSDPDTPY